MGTGIDEVQLVCGKGVFLTSGSSKLDMLIKMRHPKLQTLLLQLLEEFYYEQPPNAQKRFKSYLKFSAPSTSNIYALHTYEKHRFMEVLWINLGRSQVIRAKLSCM